MQQHFGLKLRASKYGYKLTRENYVVVDNKNSFYPKVNLNPGLRKTYEQFRLNYKRLGFEPYTDDTYTVYTDEWCKWHYENCMKNFDWNMKFFSSLDREKFNAAINEFLTRNQEFIPVLDLNIYRGVSGYYMMVLDDYCQIYIGTAKDITKRIRTHWINRKPFDRILLPHGNIQSIISIDSFRALDTTRIYVAASDNLYENEDKYICDIPGEFCSNRFSGGLITTPLPSNVKTRHVID
ncbi:MAG: hypothetical protein J1E36_04540 [Eubacterium sp.]|nr:hypothetical protein [Eubacterium sp.]